MASGFTGLQWSFTPQLLCGLERLCAFLRFGAMRRICDAKDDISPAFRTGLVAAVGLRGNSPYGRVPDMRGSSIEEQGGRRE
ncbi:protein of unknown function [Candidatus Nitrospira inopinata]|uniref:Uncharacterized protein n=1 Tax=Candidatus Nitrospira inopinata TaxID=1715989 RepID=A0A0S4KV57_9BACT|nr:protein of unknown function [Candidatus Nitrospira inopinata]